MTLDALLDEMIGSARAGNWDRNGELAPAMAAALSALGADLQTTPLGKEEVAALKALQEKIDAASRLSEERLTQIRPLIEAFGKNSTAADTR